MLKSVYLNLEDDVPKIMARITREKSSELVLVVPKKSYLFSDSINLRLLKKQVDLLGKKVAILTMDEVGQMYAKEAGFPLKFLSRGSRPAGVSDIRMAPRPGVRKVRRAAPAPVPIEPVEPEPVIDEAVPADAEEEFTAPPQEVLPEPAPQAFVHDVQVYDTVFGDTNIRVPSNPYQSPSDLPEEPLKGQPTAYKKILVGFVAISLIVILLLVLVILPKADITVYAKDQPVARDVELSAATALKEPDVTKLAIPATIVQKTVDGNSSFTTTGKKEVGARAQGRIAIYNLTRKPLNLKASTTILSVGSKNYSFTSDQTGIRVITDKNADPATLPAADVVAQNGGDDSNLPAGTRVEISNQVFGSQPQALYAKTLTAITGGSSRFISVITEDDITKAKATLANQLVDQVRTQLKDSGLVLVDGAFSVDFVQFTTDKPVGTESPTFQAQGSARVSGIAFSEDDLKQVVRQRITMTFSDNKRLQDQSADVIAYEVKNKDLGTGVLSMSIHYDSNAGYDLNVNDLPAQISGKSRDQASQLLLAKPEIDRVDISLSPSWQTSLPRLKSKIHIQIKK